MVPAILLSNTTVLTTISATNKPTSPNPITLQSLTKSGKLDHALRLIESQPSNSAEACSLLLHACISRRSLDHGRRLYLHLKTADKSLLNNPRLRAKLVTLFSVCGRLDEARAVFRGGLDEDDNGPAPESVWVAMAIGYSKNGLSNQALLLYSEMLSRFVFPGNFSFSTALKACAEVLDLRVGRAVHAQIVKSQEEPDQVVNNALLRLYSQCGRFDDASKKFDKMPRRNVASWNSLISEFSERDRVFDALDAFRRMQAEGVGFSWVTLTAVLAVCSRATALLSGREIHAQMVKSGDGPDAPAMNSLLDMYAKCGEIEYCRRAFEGMSFRNSTSWNTVLAGYALNGRMESAAELFDEMVDAPVRPDGVTFLALLSGCSHAGLADKGRKIFESMESRYRVAPAAEHYACLVDILGRAGYIKEALEVVEAMPMRPGGSVFGSLLNSCRLHNNVALGELVAEHLFELEPDNPGNYVILSNIYANAQMWERAKRVREVMRQRGVRKEAGCSWTQIRGGTRAFVSGGSLEMRESAEFKKVWDELSEALERDGYRKDASVVLHEVGEETKAAWVCGHSERLAAAFALVSAPGGLPIRVTKNLRVCADCHSWMKHVSKVAERTIVLRDTNRFHHFKEGVCSCKDYW